jgi:peptidoglycan hydrolase-like amidase
MKRRILLLATILILLFATYSCEALHTTITSTTKVTETTMKTETETQTQTQTATANITETVTETATVTVTIIPIRVKRLTHGNGQIEALDMESEYLPVVVASENLDAPFESLKAQAIAARTFAFYKKTYEPRGTNYDILDSELDQVYDPERWEILTPEKQEQIRQAVRETNGIILKYANVIICSCYVSGNPNMLHWVTFNEGKSGDNITQTTMINYSYPPSLTPHNRGCMGQVQANELAAQGYTYEQILRYFYGEDISIIKYEAYY